MRVQRVTLNHLPASLTPALSHRWEREQNRA
jgi:hypothetical protein